MTFTRTECSCATCRQCCKDQPGSLAAGDLERIAAYLQQPIAAVLVKFWASPGALLMNRATGAVYQQGTITPQLRRGRCVFLDEHERCTIHPVAPAGCALFDTHMDAATAQPRSAWLARSQSDPDYQSIRRTLTPARNYKPRAY